MYITADCNWTPYGTDPKLDKKVDSYDWQVRKEVAEQGYGLDKLITDKNIDVREEVARQGYGLDILIDDKHEYVRQAVAKHGYGLDKLIDDKTWYVRIEVARQGYGLDKLIDDEDSDVCQAVRNYLLGDNLTLAQLAQWKKQHPEKCVLEESEDEKAIEDFIYKVEDSQKITIINNDFVSIDTFFNIKENGSITIGTVDTHEPIFKLEKQIKNNKEEYKFIVDITNEKGEDFIIRSYIKNKEQLNKLIEQVVEALNSLSQFSKYADDLENCVS